jgi:hypothetical protein
MIKTAAAAFLIATATVVPQAHADASTFLQEVRAAGIIVTDDVAIKNANLICQWMTAGATAMEASQRMSEGSGLDIGHTLVFTAISVQDYCPQFLDAPSPRGLTPKHPQEDEPGWDCRTMGNHICGPGNDQDVPPGDYTEEYT